MHALYKISLETTTAALRFGSVVKPCALRAQHQDARSLVTHYNHCLHCVGLQFTIYILLLHLRLRLPHEKQIRKTHDCHDTNEGCTQSPMSQRRNHRVGTLHVGASVIPTPTLVAAIVGEIVALVETLEHFFTYLSLSLSPSLSLSLSLPRAQ